ncbi:MAG: sulfotransferase [Thermoplasmata archaeon]|nr:sulfotransferase [Thermoplasmata archaeon]
MVYIVGSVRSGSTLLDVLLGSHPDIHSTGELARISKYYEPPGYRCSCGKGASECPFWSGVLQDFERTSPLQELNRGWRRFEGFRAFPRTWWGARTGTRALREQVARLGEMIRSIARASGKGTVIDSSKDPVRGFLYSLLPSDAFDVRYIHLVRDGRGFMFSVTARPDGAGLGQRHKKGRPAAVRALEWASTNLLTSILFAGGDTQYLRLRYEDFVAQPSLELRRIGTFLGTDLSSIAEDLSQGRAVPIAGHIVGGNRLRFNAAVIIQPDTEWQRRLPARLDWTFWGLAGWLALAYGYHRTAG